MKQLFSQDLQRAAKWYLHSKTFESFTGTLLTIFLTIVIVILALKTLAEMKATFGM